MPETGWLVSTRTGTTGNGSNISNNSPNGTPNSNTLELWVNYDWNATQMRITGVWCRSSATSSTPPPFNYLHGFTVHNSSTSIYTHTGSLRFDFRPNAPNSGQVRKGDNSGVWGPSDWFNHGGVDGNNTALWFAIMPCNDSPCDHVLHNVWFCTLRFTQANLQSVTRTSATIRYALNIPSGYVESIQSAFRLNQGSGSNIPDGNWTSHSTSGGPADITRTGLTPNTNYQFQVWMNAHYYGGSRYSGLISVTTWANITAGSITVTATTLNSFSFSWGTASRATAQRRYRRRTRTRNAANTDWNAWPAWSTSWDNTVNTSNATSGSVTVTGLSPNTQHEIQLEVSCASETTHWSVTITSAVITLPDIARITAPTSFNLGTNPITNHTNPGGTRNDLQLLNRATNAQIHRWDNIAAGNNITRSMPVRDQNSTNGWDAIYRLMTNVTAGVAALRWRLHTYVPGNTSIGWSMDLDVNCNITGDQPTIRPRLAGQGWRRGFVRTKVSGIWRLGLIWSKITGQGWRRGI